MMNKLATTALWDCLILLALLILSLGIWYFPAVTMGLLALLVICGCVCAK
jgi:hypothetical protein